MKKITVAMSCYNHEKYVAQAVESVLNQTCKDFYFWVADDGSRDKTAEILLKYENEIDEIHLFEDNAGANGRGNFFLEKAQTEYWALINSDDYWEPDKLQKQLLYLESHPECAACFTWCNQVDENGRVVEPINNFCHPNTSREQMLAYFWDYGNYLAHPSILIRTDIMQSLATRQIKGFRQLPDFDMWVKLVQEAEIYIIEENLLNYRWHVSEQNINVSAISAENYSRYHVEISYMWYQAIKNMKTDMFKRTFLNRFLYKQASTEEEIMCEKFFLFIRNPVRSIQHAGVVYFYSIYGNDNVRKIFKDIYGFTEKEFWKINVQIGMGRQLLEAAIK